MLLKALEADLEVGTERRLQELKVFTSLHAVHKAW